MKSILFAAVVLTALTLPAAFAAETSTPGAEEIPGRWTAERAEAWYGKTPWLLGFNYVPSTAVNDTEMWDASTFDPTTIDRELAWAEGIGFNSCRIFLQYIVWKADPPGLKGRVEKFLEIADRRRISVLPILFDDCAFDASRDPYPGKQDEPVPGVHNSRWVPSPGAKLVADRAAWPDLERYMKELVGAFGRDRRVVMWDLYNEPGNSPLGAGSLPLVEAAFRWAREAKPEQPLTTCIFGPPEMAARIPALSDIINIHHYGPLDGLRAEVERLRKRHRRPVVVTEWMARTAGSFFGSHLPWLRDEKVGCWSWGLVAGRTQTYFPWGSKPGSPEPALWHHDILRRDGTPWDPSDVLAIGLCAGVLRMEEVVPTSEKSRASWRFTTERPPEGWSSPGFDDSRWPVGAAPFGSREPEFGRLPGTPWGTPDIWLRREVVLPDPLPADLVLLLSHDEDVEVRVNGVDAAAAKGFNVGYAPLLFAPGGRAALRPGKNLLAVHCRQTGGGQYIDLGIARLIRSR